MVNRRMRPVALPLITPAQPLLSSRRVAGSWGRPLCAARTAPGTDASLDFWDAAPRFDYTVPSDNAWRNRTRPFRLLRRVVSLETAKPDRDKRSIQNSATAWRRMGQRVCLFFEE